MPLGLVPFTRYVVMDDASVPTVDTLNVLYIKYHVPALASYEISTKGRRKYDSIPIFSDILLYQYNLIHMKIFAIISISCILKQKFSLIQGYGKHIFIYQAKAPFLPWYTGQCMQKPHSNNETLLLLANLSLAMA